jgi:hypothetical protein
MQPWSKVSHTMYWMRMSEMELPWFPNGDADEVLKGCIETIHIVDHEKKLKEIEPDIYGEFIVAYHFK